MELNRMSKYNALFQYVKEREEGEVKLSFQKIKEILGFNIDHSFLRYKKDLLVYGWEVKKISMKEEAVLFKRIEE